MVTCNAFDCTKKESTTPKGVAFPHLAPRGGLLSSATPGYRKYNPDGVVVSLPIYYRTTTRGWCTTWHLSSHHNAECDHTTTWGCAPHGHSLPSYGIEIVRNIDICHRPQRGVCRCRNVGLCAAWTFIAKPCHRRITQHGIYHRAITRGVTILSRGIAPQMARAYARKGAGEVTPKGLYF